MTDAENQHFEFLDALPKKAKTLTFANRVGCAAGFDKNGEYIDELAALGVGHIEIGSVTRYPQSGNPKPRVWRYPDQGTIVNKMGMPNKGIDYALLRIEAARKRAAIGLSIAAQTVEDYVYCYQRAAFHVDFVTLNISCPNVQGGQSFQNPANLTELLEATHKYRSASLVVKISPDLTKKELVKMVDLFNDFEIDGVTCSNLTHHHNFPHEGGASGATAKEASMRTVSTVVKGLKNTKIIASGGILTAKDAQDYFDVGADYVQVFTGLLLNGPQLIEDIKNCVH
jgi:dihydroorotate dehydrogenase